MNKHLDQLIQKEMTRQEFLATLGFGMASIFGFSTIIHLLTGHSSKHYLGRGSDVGYGSSAYGGTKDRG